MVTRSLVPGVRPSLVRPLTVVREASPYAPVPITQTTRAVAVASANPQLSPTRAGLVPGSAPTFVTAVAPALKPQPTQLVTPQEPSMSLLGRIGGALKGAIGGFVTGGPAGALGGAALGAISSGGARRPATNVLVGAGTATLGTSLVGRSSACPPGSMNVAGRCIDAIPGGAGSGSGLVVSPGDPRTSRAMIGASAYAPMRTTLEVRRCERGAVLGIDGLCYDKRTIRKDQRMWVPGRKPLLTGGDLNAISKAARAARRMKGQQRRLEQLGLLKRPKPSRGVITKAEAARALRR